MPDFRGKINEKFRIENARNLTRVFYANFNKKILLNFLVKIVIKNSFIKFSSFSRQNCSFIFPPIRVIIEIINTMYNF